MCGKRKRGVFLAVSLGFKVSFKEISQCRHVRDLITTLNVQVTILVTCLHLAGTVSRILLPAVSSCRGVIPSQKNRIEFQWRSKLLGTGPWYCWGYCSWSIVERTLRIRCSYCMDGTPVTVAAAYPQSTLNGTPTCSSLSDTMSYETYVAG